MNVHRWISVPRDDLFVTDGCMICLIAIAWLDGISCRGYGQLFSRKTREVL
jgi:hypothetical protein